MEDIKQSNEFGVVLHLLKINIDCSPLFPVFILKDGVKVGKNLGPLESFSFIVEKHLNILSLLEGELFLNNNSST